VFWLSAFCVLMLLFIALGSIPLRYWRGFATSHRANSEPESAHPRPIPPSKRNLSKKLTNPA